MIDLNVSPLMSPLKLSCQPINRLNAFWNDEWAIDCVEDEQRIDSNNVDVDAMEHGRSDDDFHCSNAMGGNELTNVNNIDVDELVHLMEKYPTRRYMCLRHISLLILLLII